MAAPTDCTTEPVDAWAGEDNEGRAERLACKIATLRQEWRRLGREMDKLEKARHQLVLRRNKVVTELKDLEEGR